jgi:hypothetical protein
MLCGGQREAAKGLLTSTEEYTVRIRSHDHEKTSESLLGAINLVNVVTLPLPQRLIRRSETRESSALKSFARTSVKSRNTICS